MPAGLEVTVPPPIAASEAGVAVRVAAVAPSEAAVHAMAHSMPAGLEVAVPVLEPSRVTERVNWVTAEETPKRANTVVLAVRVRVQGPVPVQLPPAQPSKVEPVAGVAARVTTVPLS